MQKDSEKHPLISIFTFGFYIRISMGGTGTDSLEDIFVILTVRNILKSLSTPHQIDC